MATEKVSEQAASISSIDMNNNKQVKLKKLLQWRQLQGWEYFEYGSPVQTKACDLAEWQ